MVSDGAALSVRRESLRVRLGRRLGRHGVALADVRERFFGVTPKIVRPQRVVFVCRGNVCRSVFAEHRLRGLDPRLTVESAGTHVRVSSPSPPTAVSLARELGLDLASHRSRSVDTFEDTPQTAYFAFEPWQLRAIEAARPAAAGRIFPLAAWAVPRRSTIPDPYGGDTERFRATFRLIDVALDRLTSAWGEP